MGLPLFHAPVESDITSKPAHKNPVDPATVRSPIRRAERRRQLLETRTHRLQLLQALQSNDPEGIEAPVPGRLPSEPRSRPRHELISAITGERRYPGDIWSNVDTDYGNDPYEWAFPGSRPDVPRPTALPGPEALIAGDSYAGPDYIRPPPAVDFDPRILDDRRFTHRDGGPPRRSRDLPYATAGGLRPPLIHRSSSLESAAASRSSRARNPDPGEYLHEYRRRRNLQESAPRERVGPRRLAPGRYVRYMDGLGDRERSPEDDGAWDTLQASITPDPQPPSVGSSFASTTVSAAVSQTTVSSSSTSVTHPDEEVAEPPCDPVDQNIDSDQEDDEDGAELRRQPSRRPTPHGFRRSYTDVAADILPPGHDDGPDSLEWLSEMRRIVQGLASRQDIPDQWWASVGLTRSMTSE